jgi:hypothetical protein
LDIGFPLRGAEVPKPRRAEGNSNH